MAADENNKAHDGAKSFNAYRDENGQGMSDNPADVANPASLRHQLMSNPGGEAETARIASGQPAEDATDAVEAETPAENIAHIGDATLPTREEAAAAIERATASLGSDKPTR